MAILCQANKLVKHLMYGTVYTHKKKKDRVRERLNGMKLIIQLEPDFVEMGKGERKKTSAVSTNQI